MSSISLCPSCDPSHVRLSTAASRCVSPDVGWHLHVRSSTCTRTTPACSFHTLTQAINRELERLQGKLADAKDINIRLAADKKTANSTIQAQEERIASLQSRITVLASNLEGANADIARLEGIISRLEGDLSRSQELCALHQDANAALQVSAPPAGSRDIRRYAAKVMRTCRRWHVRVCFAF